MLPTRSIALCGAGHWDTSIPPGHWLLHRDSAAYRIDDARAADAASRARRQEGGWLLGRS